MSLMLMLDEEMANAADAMAPHKNFLDPNNPRSVTNVASIPKPVSSTTACWISDLTTRIPTPDQLAFTAALAE